MRVCDVKVSEFLSPRIFELSESDESDLRRWVDDLIRSEDCGWPLSRETYESLMRVARMELEIGNPDAIPRMISTFVSAAFRELGADDSPGCFS